MQHGSERALGHRVDAATILTPYTAPPAELEHLMTNDPTCQPTRDNALLSLVYASKAVVGFTSADLENLLTRTRASNAADGISGMLLFKDHRFLQLLEGPADAVRAKMRLIREDARHYDVLLLLEEHVRERQFADWTMGYAAEDVLHGVRVPGYRTTFDDIDFIPDDHDAGPVLPALRELIRWFRANPVHVRDGAV